MSPSAAAARRVRAHEMLLPAGSGRQALVYAESREACTALLRELAAELSGGKGADPIALLVDPSPEELADWKREAPRAEIVSAGKDSTPRTPWRRPRGAPTPAKRWSS